MSSLSLSVSVLFYFGSEDSSGRGEHSCSEVSIEWVAFLSISEDQIENFGSENRYNNLGVSRFFSVSSEQITGYYAILNVTTMPSTVFLIHY
jgi:hypothetical protein